MECNPIFVAGAERSGTNLMYAFLASHPRIAMTRRTNFWTYFYRRFGDLGREADFERCLAALMRYKRIVVIGPDPDRLRREFRQGAPTYGRLLSLIEQQHAERMGKPRWGDKSLNTERYAEAVFTEYPGAKILHMLRHPCDRYASARTRWKVSRGQVGAGVAAWLSSARLAWRSQQRYPGAYKVVSYEKLVSSPEETLREVCDFVGEPYSPAMLTLHGDPKLRDRGGNSSYGRRRAGEISTASLGRYLQVLSKREIRFMQTLAKPYLSAFGYSAEPVELSFADRLAYYLVDCPLNLGRMAAWEIVQAVRDQLGRKLPRYRLVTATGQGARAAETADNCKPVL